LYSNLYLVKFMSHHPLNDAQLKTIFGERSVIWTTVKAWDAYPILTPPTKLDSFIVDDDLYYTNALERAVSTLETSTIAAKNTVALLLRKWLGNAFVLGHNCSFGEDTPHIAPGWSSWGCMSS